MGRVIWLTGISGSGKTTLGLELQKAFTRKNVGAALIDGDQVRAFFEDDLGYSRAERIHNVKRIAFAAKLLADQGAIVIVANIAPYYEVRDFIRRKIPGYLQVYVKVSLEVAAARDPKGHYRRSRAGTLQNLVGVDDIYDPPRRPSLVVETADRSVVESTRKILDFLREEGVY